MITRCFEPFCLLESRIAPDDTGSPRRTDVPILSFQGVVAQTASREASLHGRMIPAAHAALLHELDVTLTPGDRVRRLHDGATYRVTSRTEDLSAPDFSGLRFAQVDVEREEAPC